MSRIPCRERERAAWVKTRESIEVETKGGARYDESTRRRPPRDLEDPVMDPVDDEETKSKSSRHGTKA